MGFFPYFNVDFEYYCEKCTEFCYKFYNKEKCKNCMKIRRKFEDDIPIYFEERIKEMNKLSMDDYKLATDSILWTIAAYQQGAKTIRKENPDLSFLECSELIKGWWVGVMTMMGLGGNKEEDRGPTL